MKRLLIVGVALLSLAACSSNDESPATTSVPAGPAATTTVPSASATTGAATSPTTPAGGSTIGAINGPAQVDMTTIAAP